MEWDIGFFPKTCRVFHLSDTWIQSSDCSIVFISVIITVSKLCEKREVVQGPIIISHFLIHVQKKIELMPYFSYKPLKHAILFIETSNTCTTALFQSTKLQVVSPSYYHLSLIHGLLTLRGDSLSEANSMFVVICTDRRRTVFSDRFEKRNFNKYWYRTMISYHNLPNLKKLRDQPHQW